MKKENKKIIFICGSYYNNYDYSKLGIDFWKKKGYCVEVWCLAEIIYGIVDGERRNDMVYFSCYRKLAARLLKEKNSLFFDCLGVVDCNNLMIRVLFVLMHIRSYPFFRDPVLSPANSGIEKIENDNGNSNSKSNFCARMLKKLKNEGTLSLLDYLIEHLSYRGGKYLVVLISNFILPVNKPKIVFLSAIKNKLVLPQCYKKCHIEYLHAWDYEKYLIEESKNTIDVFAKKRYIVYIDEANVNHPDYQYLKTKNEYAQDGNEKKYYDSICKLFSYLEGIYECPVIIAAHPRADYSGNEYGNREIIKNETLELVKNSILVLTMCSTAINYVILYKIPFILICDDIILKNVGCRKRFETWEEYFQIEAYNFSRGIGELKEINRYVCMPDNKIYERYKREYIISEQNNKNIRYWEKVLNAMEAYR